MADIAPLIEEYKIRFSTYSNNMVEKAKALQAQALDVQPRIGEMAQTNFDKVKNAVVDLTPVGTNQDLMTHLLNDNMWVAVCLLLGSIGYFIGNTLAAMLLGVVFNTGLAFYLAVIVIPLAAYLVCLRTELTKDDRCAILLGATMSSSILIGYLLSWRYLSCMPPPMFLFPVVLAVGATLVGPALGDKERPQFVGVLIAVAALVAFVLGLITGNLGGVYILWIASLGGVAFLDFQLQMMRTADGNHGLASNQICSLALYQLAGLILSCVFSSSSPSEPASPVVVVAPGGK